MEIYGTAMYTGTEGTLRTARVRERFPWPAQQLDAYMETVVEGIYRDSNMTFIDNDPLNVHVPISDTNTSYAVPHTFTTPYRVDFQELWLIDQEEPENRIKVMNTVGVILP
jgi:hypothetical protein